VSPGRGTYTDLPSRGRGLEMNKDTRVIVQLLGVNEQTALKIQSKMGENGLDFSECNQREFNRAAREAYHQILQPDEH
jgi:hypothetical protein